jgi:hypothetical protein
MTELAKCNVGVGELFAREHGATLLKALKSWTPAAETCNFVMVTEI